MFRSFFLAGFEGSTGYNRHGEWFDQVVATGHEKTAKQDYRDIAGLGLLGAREAVRWPLVDLRGRYDFSTLEPFVEAAKRARVDIIWDLFHYGFPADVDLWSASFPERFANYCYAAARYVQARSEGPYVFTPVNEPSFMAYAAGEKGLFAPHVRGRGWELKVALARAAIAGIDAIRAACPQARLVNVDPLCRVVAPQGRPDLAEQARDFNERLVFQSWDMLSGRLLPELGGSPSHLDIVGVNYYWTNQWELTAEADDEGLISPLPEDDPRRASLETLLRGVWTRYGREVMLTETSHIGDHRGRWLRHVARASANLLREGVPLRGACLYPILGMPEWHDRTVWTPMGLWDPVDHRASPGERRLCTEMHDALIEAKEIEALHRSISARATQTKKSRMKRLGESGRVFLNLRRSARAAKH